MIPSRESRIGAAAPSLLGLGLAMLFVVALGARKLRAGEDDCQGAKPKAPVNQPNKELLRDGFTNSLGMKFMHVPNTRVLFCIHLTRVKDYTAYAAEAPNVDQFWKKPGKDGREIETGPDHPVVTVSWNEATAFCSWLSKKEDRQYRLPSDREWSYAIGIGPKEIVGKDTPPESLDQKIPNVYPWGSQWPPPKGAGNYADTTIKRLLPSVACIPGYADGFPATSPVMSFKPNRLGLYDMSGNVWQWCDGWYDMGRTERVLRGGSWYDSGSNYLLSSCRHHALPGVQISTCGFRVAVELPKTTS